MSLQQSDRCCAEGVKVLLLAAGLGTRLRPLTDHTPKCLVEIAGRPLLDYWFDCFAEAGLHRILVNNHHIPDKVRRYIERLKQTTDLQVRETFEPTLLGSAGTITANRAFADDAEEVIIIYADNLTDIDLRNLLFFHRSHSDPLTMVLFHTRHPSKCGIAELDKECRIISFVEKPARPKSNLANAGIYVTNAEMFYRIADMNAFDIAFDVLPNFIGQMRGWMWTGYFRDVGTIEAVEEAKRDVPRFFGHSSRLTR